MGEAQVLPKQHEITATEKFNGYSAVMQKAHHNERRSQ